MPFMSGIEVCKKVNSYFDKLEKKIEGGACGPPQPVPILHLEDSPSCLTRQRPYIYALTSESEPRILQEIGEAGFKAIYNVLTESALKEILSDAAIVFKDGDQVVEFDPDKEMPY